ncbi:radical SAM family heme chaperone HemW [Filimonas effusa]|uniref:Heme chaperone HemW n=1 Tax=Filimonas effusa TaxID=2508721 RepID=A0A4Q1D1X5_9BACT|nr:radical SAM family heme chaperone HemW [Filimonas effusa]RXK81784.1 radical SAM family heme chaperone HemW [Filimonas effusa]
MIYIHIPFCRKACHYCNFHFSTNLKTMDAVIAAIEWELVLRKDYVQGEINSVYFGGGTPSILPPGTIQRLMDRIRQTFNVVPDAEITLETNPDDITADQLELWKQAGINRLSIGIQSFFEEDLVWMNRAHNALQARQAIELAQQAGFFNITIDLIYGGPTLPDEHWRENVATAVALNIPHLSCYALTVEPQTALDKMIIQHKKEEVDPDKQSRHFELLMLWAAEAGYEHYEISNFAKPGYRSRHNSSYWAGTPYLGVGPGAHSFNGSSRQWNVSNNTLYYKRIGQQQLPFEIEYLTPEQQVNEYIMTSLRTIEGLDTSKLSPAEAERVNQLAEKYIRTNALTRNGSCLVLTNAGRLLADGIAADLFC